MLSLIRFFAQLCLLRTRPQDLPASQSLLGLVAIVNVIIGTVLVSPALGNPFTAFTASLVDTAVLAGFVLLVLKFRNHPERFIQTATSAIGVSAVISALSLPLQWMMPAPSEGMAAPSAESASLMLLILIVWLQVALGHVLRHAIDVSLMLGVGLAFLYSLFSGAAIQSLFNFPMPTT